MVFVYINNSPVLTSHSWHSWLPLNCMWISTLGTAVLVGSAVLTAGSVVASIFGSVVLGIIVNTVAKETYVHALDTIYSMHKHWMSEAARVLYAYGITYCISLQHPAGGCSPLCVHHIGSPQ